MAKKGVGALALLAVFLLSSQGIAADAGRAEPQPFSVFPSSQAGSSNQLQNPPGNQPPGGLPRVTPLQRTPRTGKEKAIYYLKTTYGPASLAYTAFGAGIKQANGSVYEWGGGMEGYGRRYASSFGQKAISRSIRHGLGGLLHEDPRFLPSSRSGVWKRTIDATKQVFFAHKDGGGQRIAYSRFAGNFGAAYISRQWRPERYRDATDVLSVGFASLGIDVAKTVFSEFWPDIKKRLRP